MSTSDDPAARVPGPAWARSRSIGTAAGLALTALAAVVAVAFGIARADDPGAVALGVVGLHDRASQGPPPAGEGGGFARRAAADGWVATGGRVDVVEGRRAVTTFWERAGRRVAYTRVAGDPVEAPEGARRTGRRGVLLRSFDADGRVAVAWTEGGHTAVISAAGVSRAALYDLAGGRPLG